MAAKNRAERNSLRRADNVLDRELHALFASVYGADPALDGEYRAELVRRLGKQRVLEALAGARGEVDEDRLVELLGGWGVVADVVDVVERDYTEKLRSARATR